MRATTSFLDFSTSRASFRLALVVVWAMLACLVEPSFATESVPTADDTLSVLFTDAWSRLPPLVQDVLTDQRTGRSVVTLRLDQGGADVPDARHFCDVSEAQSGMELARFEPHMFGRGGVVVLNASLLARYTPGMQGKSPIACRHGSLHAEVLATVLHELGHAYEREARRRKQDSVPSRFPIPSADGSYLSIADFDPGVVFPSNKNTHPLRSPDPYEIRSAQESFAVNFEYFLLDEAFACRRPTVARYLSRIFRFEPFSNRNCRINTKAFAMADVATLLRDLDPDRIYRVDYLVASPGTSFVSRWGHSMLRLVVCAPQRTDSTSGLTVPAATFGPGCVENTFDHLVVSYRADLRGIAPGFWSLVKDRYPSRLFLITFDEIFREYLYGDLRNLVAYPLVLSEEEKRALVHKILESYWGYEGDYHFLGNNCATETRDLVSSIKRQSGEERISTALSPLGVRDDWESSRWIDLANARTYPSLLPVLKRIWNEQTIPSGQHLSSDADAQSAIVKYMRDSRAQERWKQLQDRSPNSKIASIAVRDFVVFEAQILRFREQALKDEVFSLGRMRAPSLFRAFESSMKTRPDTAGGVGYGIALSSEIPSEEEALAASERVRRSFEELKGALQGDLADPIREIEATRENLRKAFVLQAGMTKTAKTSSEPAIVPNQQQEKP